MALGPHLYLQLLPLPHSLTSGPSPAPPHHLTSDGIQEVPFPDLWEMAVIWESNGFVSVSLCVCKDMSMCYESERQRGCGS